ncbi:MAG: c-type cytochrome biogenesis protein CcsB [Candidatus Latescibacteria bacterium]|nr:c-type cytochrome biogenesis protein CcsB [Candidatus Latescibacterota bacterium]
MINTIINIALAGYLISAVSYIPHLFSKQKTLSITSTITMILALSAHTVAIAVRWHMADHLPLTSLYESIILFAWLIVVTYLAVEFLYKLSIMRPFVTAIVILALSYASCLNSSIRPLMPALQSSWLGIHVVASLIGYAFFTISFVSSVIYLALFRGSAPNRPSLVSNLDALSYRTISLGFLFLALGIITGSVWAERAWGSYWSWDPKETWALITWLIYAIYLHARFITGWRAQRRAWLAVVGFLSLIFTYVGVRLLPGLH